ncbi:MAG: hypothetical protein II960_06675, partial [Synergistaceae bacterium]|nr:hypothetical protein [Synergistaceae bacterium]
MNEQTAEEKLRQTLENEGNAQTKTKTKSENNKTKTPPKKAIIKVKDKKPDNDNKAANSFMADFERRVNQSLNSASVIKASSQKNNNEEIIVKIKPETPKKIEKVKIPAPVPVPEPIIEPIPEPVQEQKPEIIEPEPVPEIEVKEVKEEVEEVEPEIVEEVEPEPIPEPEPVMSNLSVDESTSPLQMEDSQSLYVSGEVADLSDGGGTENEELPAIPLIDENEADEEFLPDI